jgi:hypothetical protein
MTNRTMDVLRYDVTDLSQFDNYLGSEPSDTEVMVTVTCGEISGEIERVVSREEDGGLVATYGARVDGLLREPTGVARIESDSVEELRCLAMCQWTGGTARGRT